MPELYEKQEDGTLKPVEYPEQLVKNIVVYEWLRAKGLTQEEIKIISNPTWLG